MQKIQINSRQIILVLVLFAAIFLTMSGAPRKAFVSKEVTFTDASRSGLSIMPASCASNPGYYHNDLTPSADGLGFVSYPGESEFGVTRNSIYLCLTNSSQLYTDIADGKPTTASSYNGAGYEPAKAFDNNDLTMWNSQATQNSTWIQVDVGSVKPFSLIKVDWYTTLFIPYFVQISNDGTNWTTIVDQPGHHFWTMLFHVSGSARYFRIINNSSGVNVEWAITSFKILTPSAGSLTYFIPANTAAEMNAAKAAGASLPGMQVW